MDEGLQDLIQVLRGSVELLDGKPSCQRTHHKSL